MSTYNFLGLVNDVNRRLNEVELTSGNFATAVGFYAAVKDAVNSTLRDINQQEFEWPFNHVLQEEDLNVGEIRYFVPRDTKSLDMDSFRIVRNDDFGTPTQRLKLISYEEYLDKHIDKEYNTDESLHGLPMYVFRTPSLEYGVVPAPDKEYTINYEYYRNPVSLELFSDVPSIPEEFRYVIADGALVHAYNFRGDTANAQLSEQRFQLGLKSMRSLYINRYEYLRSTVIKV